MNIGTDDASNQMISVSELMLQQTRVQSIIAQLSLILYLPCNIIEPITPPRFEENDSKRVDEDIWSPKFLSRDASRRSKTPTLKSRLVSRHGSRRCITPTSLSRSSSSSGRTSATKITASSLKRIMSRRGSPASEPELTNHVASPRKDADACLKTTRKPECIPAVSLSSNLSCRLTTPIMFSQITTRRKPLEVERKLHCTLENLCFGCIKKIKVTKDLIKYLGREGNDLEICVEITLVNALTGCSISIPLLGGENTGLSFENNVIYPGYEKVIKGQGMPNPKNNGIRDDLHVKFFIEFPTELSEEQRKKVASILQDC
ncbi:hypothetical protein JHK87_027909 [Glycine soja]|nr:hypothetical protein JHK87_027909 [Glycine soja]